MLLAYNIEVETDPTLNEFTVWDRKNQYIHKWLWNKRGMVKVLRSGLIATLEQNSSGGQRRKLYLTILYPQRWTIFSYGLEFELLE